MLEAFPGDAPVSPGVAAASWAAIVERNTDWFRLLDLLFNIIEANVAVEKLVHFKRGYYGMLPELQASLSVSLGVTPERVEPLTNTVSYQAVGLVNNVCNTPQVHAAMREMGFEPRPTDVRGEMEAFVALLLEHERGWRRGVEVRGADGAGWPVRG